MINGLDIYYSNVGRGLKPVGNNKTANELKPVSNKGGSCERYGRGLRILQ